MESIQLRKIFTNYFNEGELRTLCFDLKIDYESLPGEGKENKARELISYFERHRHISELVDICRQLRPNAFKGTMSRNTDSSGISPNTASTWPIINYDFVLYVISPVKGERLFPLDKGHMIIGRSVDADISIPDDPYISRMQFIIEWNSESKSHTIFNAGNHLISVNGITVQRLQTLKTGDEIRTGRTVFRYKSK